MKQPLAARIEKLGGQHLHQRPWTFKQLCKEYQGHDELLVEITDREQALKDIRSTASCTWNAGRLLGETGWMQLASPSKVSAKDTRTVFVCLADLVA